jgi:lipoprotein-releasing system permease protein
LALRYLSFLEQGSDGRYRLSSAYANKSLSAVLGLALGAAVLLIVLSIVNGFEREMRERVLSIVPHALLHNAEGIADWQKLSHYLAEGPKSESLVRPIAAAPLESFQGLLIQGERLASVNVSAIEPEAEQGVSIVEELMLEGSLNNLKKGQYGIVLGSALAKKLGVSAGDKLKLMLPEAQISLLGLMPRYRQFTLVGIVEVGAALDQQLAYIHINDGLKLLRKKSPNSIRLKMPRLFSASWDAWELVGVLNDDEGKENLWFATDWTQSEGSLYEIIIMTKSMLGLLVLLIVIVACFNLSSSLIMLVNDKRSDIAILLSQGLRPTQVIYLFVIQAVFIASLALLAGLSVAALVLHYLKSWVANLEQSLAIDLTSAYPVHYLPSHILASDIVVISVSVILLSMFASIYPALLAARVQPAEELKYE